MKTLSVFYIFKLLQLSVDLTRKQAGGNRDILLDIWYGGIISHFSDSYPVISNWLSFWVSLFLKTFRFNQPHLRLEPYSFLKYEIVVGQFLNYRNFPPNYMLIVWTTKYQQTLRFYILFVRSDLWLLDKNLRLNFNSFYKNYKLLCIWNVFPFSKNSRIAREDK